LKWLWFWHKMKHMENKGSRRKFLQDAMSVSAGTAASVFYATLLKCTQAAASDEAIRTLTQEQKEFLDKMAATTEELDPRALWAILKDGGDGDKYGGPMEEFSAKKK
jgi:hypothetical protein